MQLAIASKFLSAVRKGKKKSTIRAGRRNMRSGPAVFVSGKQHVEIEIQKVLVKPFGKLTQKDARLDGFKTLAELKRTLEGFYPKLDDKDEVTIIYFSLAGKSENTGASFGWGQQTRRVGYG